MGRSATVLSFIFLSAFVFAQAVPATFNMCSPLYHGTACEPTDVAYGFYLDSSLAFSWDPVWTCNGTAVYDGISITPSDVITMTGNQLNEWSLGSSYIYTPPFFWLDSTTFNSNPYPNQYYSRWTSDWRCVVAGTSYCGPVTPLYTYSVPTNIGNINYGINIIATGLTTTNFGDGTTFSDVKSDAIVTHSRTYPALGSYVVGADTRIDNCLARVDATAIPGMSTHRYHYGTHSGIRPGVPAIFPVQRTGQTYTINVVSTPPTAPNLVSSTPTITPTAAPAAVPTAYTYGFTLTNTGGLAALVNNGNPVNVYSVPAGITGTAAPVTGIYVINPAASTVFSGSTTATLAAGTYPVYATVDYAAEPAYCGQTYSSTLTVLLGIVVVGGGGDALDCTLAGAASLPAAQTGTYTASCTNAAALPTNCPIMDWAATQGTMNPVQTPQQLNPASDLTAPDPTAPLTVTITANGSSAVNPNLRCTLDVLVTPSNATVCALAGAVNTLVNAPPPVYIYTASCNDSTGAPTLCPPFSWNAGTYSGSATGAMTTPTGSAMGPQSNLSTGAGEGWLNLSVNGTTTTTPNLVCSMLVNVRAQYGSDFISRITFSNNAPLIGQEVIVNVTTANDGNEDAADSHSQLNYTAPGGTSPVIAEEWDVGAIAAGDPPDVHSYRFICTTAGAYTFTSMGDSQGEVTEINETNNMFEAPLMCRTTVPPACPDYV